MHYKNGRAAKVGDLVVNFNGTFSQLGILHSTSSASDTCNGRLAIPQPTDPYINIKDCLHVEDIAAATVPDSTAAAKPAGGLTSGATLATLAVLAVVALALSLSGCMTDTHQVVTPQGTNTVVTVNTNNLILDCAGIQIIAMGATMAVVDQDNPAEPELRAAQLSLGAALKGADPNTVGQVMASLGQSTNPVMVAQMGKIAGGVSSMEQSLLAKYGPTVGGQIGLGIAQAVYDGMTSGLVGQP